MGQIASTAQLRMSLVRWKLVVVPLVLLLGTLSGRLSNSGYGNRWFAALAKPDFMPPGWVFGVAWTIFYIMMGMALALVLQARGARWRWLGVILFVIQLALNLAWSPLFFALHRVTEALWLIGAIFGFALLATICFFAVRRIAGLLMLPYLGWLVFASLLTSEVDRLNPDAETLAPATVRTQIRS